MGDDKPAELATSRAAVTGGPSLERGRPDGVTVESQPKKEASLGRDDKMCIRDRSWTNATSCSSSGGVVATPRFPSAIPHLCLRIINHEDYSIRTILPIDDMVGIRIEIKDLRLDIPHVRGPRL